MVNPNINDNLPLDKAELVSFFLESLLYGVSLLLFGATIYVLVYRRKTDNVNRRLVATSCVMMFLGTLHLAVDFSRILEGFIDFKNSPGGPIAYFAQLFQWKHVFKTAIFVVQTVIADSFASYRCYVVWNRVWVLVLPTLLVLGTLVAGIGVVYECAILKEGQDVFASALTGWISSFFSLTLATNLICTSLIAFRIWFTTRKVARYNGQASLMPVVIVVVESGMIYSASCITLLVVYSIGSNAQYPVLDGVFPLISIVFNLIIVRIALGLAHSGSQHGGGVSSLHAGPGHGMSGSASGGVSQNRPAYPMRPLAVTVTQLVEEDNADLELGTKGGPHAASFNSESDDTSTAVVSPVRSQKERMSWNAV